MRIVSMIEVLWLVALLGAADQIAALNNGLASNPPMGFNTWNHFHCDINETLMKKTADQLVDLGLAEVGYVYLNIDDCWHARERDSSGSLHAHPERFPSGIPALADYAHARGLKLGIYSDGGTLTCAGFPGSLGYETQDARLFASWEVDYLKYDNCFAETANVKERYVAMRDALNATGRPIVFSMCSWGVGAPWRWGMQVGNTWRIDGDIDASWTEIVRSLDSAIGLSEYAGPGGWNDPDMLELGNGGLEPNQERSHFALWALLKAPLLIGADLTKIPPATVEILRAKEVIAINQDKLGVAGDLVFQEGLFQIWAAPLDGGARAVVLFNRRAPVGLSERLVVKWEYIGFESNLQASVRELFTGQELGVFEGEFGMHVPGHDVAVLRIIPAYAPDVDIAQRRALEAWRPWHTPLQQALKRRRREYADDDGMEAVGGFVYGKDSVDMKRVRRRPQPSALLRGGGRYVAE